VRGASPCPVFHSLRIPDPGAPVKRSSQFGHWHTGQGVGTDPGPYWWGPQQPDQMATATLRHPIIRHTAAPRNFAGLVRAIEKAQASGLKRISMRFADFIIKPSKYEGKMYVFSHEKELNQWGTMSNKYLGWITSNATSLGEVSLIQAVESAAADPYAAAKVYGQETGQCSCCGRELTNKLSIELGIGPICREKFGL
jgi:hypothetical protein